MYKRQALATAVSPIISISICSRHFFKKENSVQFVRPRPSYQHDPQRVYGMEFGPVEVHFTVDGEVLRCV